MTKIHIYTDGGTAGPAHSGIAAVAYMPNGRFLGWESRQLPTLTNNEAEYHAMLLGLSLAQRLNATHLHIFADSEIMIRQMQGRSRVLSKKLRKLHQQACAASRHLPHISYTHIPREKNRVADALASDAIEGKTVTMGKAQRSHQLRAAIQQWGKRYANRNLL